MFELSNSCFYSTTVKTVNLFIWNKTSQINPGTNIAEALVSNHDILCLIKEG